MEGGNQLQKHGTQVYKLQKESEYRHNLQKMHMQYKLPYETCMTQKLIHQIELIHEAETLPCQRYTETVRIICRPHQ